jgi:aminoglycoside phosphotransferase (APT) family kinase protein
MRNEKQRHSETTVLERTLNEVLASVLSRSVAIEAIRLTEGGVSNRSYRVSTDRGEYVVKLRQPGHGDVLGIDEECALMRRAADARLAPRVLGVDEKRRALVTSYRQGSRPWTSAEAGEPANIRRAAELLRALHALPARVREFECGSCARRYVEAADAASGEPEQRRLAEEFLGLAEYYDARHPGSVLCHNDLIADNILDDGTLALVDFEYAMGAAPILDLASLAAMNSFDAARRKMLLEAYYGRKSAPFATADFDKVVRLLSLMAFFWARLAASEVSDPDRLAAFGEPDAGS